MTCYIYSTRPSAGRFSVTWPLGPQNLIMCSGQRLCWVAAALIVATLVITILRRDNFLHWFFGWTVVVALFLCIYTAAWGLNRQGPDISSDMRLETSSDYTSSQLQAAAEYYLDEATKAAEKSRGTRIVFARQQTSPPWQMPLPVDLRA